MRNPKHLPELSQGNLVWLIKTPYLSNLNIVQSCFWVVFPVWFDITPLENHVVSVVCIRPKKQMVRIYARAIVALMQNVHRIRNRPKRQNPNCAVRRPKFPLHPEDAIATTTEYSDKRPTFIWPVFVHQGPEPFFDWNPESKAARQATEMALAYLYLARGFIEQLAASLANAIGCVIVGVHWNLLVPVPCSGCSSSAELLRN